MIGAQAIGSAALDALQAAPQGQAIGQTSGGIFLRTETDWVLFLSFTGWRGPLTINLLPDTNEVVHIDLHSPFLIQTSSFYFPVEQITIEFDQAERWSPPPTLPDVFPLANRVHRFTQVVTAVTAALADRLETGRDTILNLDVLFAPGSSGLSAARMVLASGQPGGIIEILVAGLGRGPGLTPAGDDVALGFLLALNRWGDRLLPDVPQEPINLALIDAARRKTTALSACLIECAAAGLADERLVAALDGLVSGNLAVDRIVEYLLAWGHTSGSAALRGMGLAIT